MILNPTLTVRRGHLPPAQDEQTPFDRYWLLFIWYKLLFIWYRLLFGWHRLFFARYRLLVGWIAVLAMVGCTDRAPPTGKSDAPSAVTPTSNAAKVPATAPPGNESTEQPRIPTSANWNPLTPDDPAMRAAQTFLKAFGEGAPAAPLLTDRLLKHLGRPWELPEDRTRGYSRLNADSLLRRWGNSRNFGLPTGGGNARMAVLHGEFRSSSLQGHYALRLVAEGNDWKVDGVCLSSAAWPQEPSGVDTAGASAAATVKMLGSVLCDRAAVAAEDRTLLLADLLSAELRQTWAPPFDSDRTSGFDFNRGQLRLKLDELASGATAYRVELISSPKHWRLILLRSDRPHAAWDLTLSADEPATFWHIHRLTPQPSLK